MAVILSLSARRAWIEILQLRFHGLGGRVALRKESVDRNILCGFEQKAVEVVALRKESVDRNAGPCPALQYLRVALRKESVDRNSLCII